MPTKQTKGQIEADISKAVVKFERDHMGRGPHEVRSHIVQDMILIRLKGVLTQAEKQLVKSEGAELLKQVRTKLLEHSSDRLKEVVTGLTGCHVVSMHSDLSTRTEERVILFVLDRNLEDRLRQELSPSI
ncbi:MAG: DUF2294 domain-containing protein [Candidatus Tectomicrobia bacterium]|uniref:DUF2294 domain-containing protein n=1 Tax=Tectimicrobiota bacterium TaxID=2528274 RepID=A0A932GQ18_UNCTE|nr:DUF2294 domain-containing protein [Candidatus Tectomicrobia bacterium]